MTKNEATKLKALIRKHVEAQIELVLSNDDRFDAAAAKEAEAKLNEYIEQCIRLE